MPILLEVKFEVFHGLRRNFPISGPTFMKLKIKLRKIYMFSFHNLRKISSQKTFDVK